MNPTKNYKFSFEFDGIEIYIFFVESNKDIEYIENCNDKNDLIFIEKDYYVGSTTFNFYIINFDGFTIKFKGLAYHETIDRFEERIERVRDPLALQISYFKLKQVLIEMKRRNTYCDYLINRLENEILNFVAVGEKRLLNYEFETECESDMDTY